VETIRFDYLKTFLTVAKNHSFSAAAKELDLTQGAVSHHIAALEEAFEVELFHRATGGVEVTEAGAVLAEAAKKILAAVDRAKVEISATKHNLSGTIRIDASTIPGEHIIPSLIYEFQKLYPDVKFKIRAEDSINSLQNLLAGSTDFAAVGTLEGLEGKVEAVVLGEEELVIIVPNNHKLANRKSAELAEITQSLFVNREETSGTRKEIENMLKKADIDPSKLKTVLELASTEAVITAVAEGRGVSIVSSIASKRAQAAGLIKTLHIEGVKSARKLYMARPKRSLAKTLEAFWEFCKGYKA
jgi:DNA-binding transcriptional LysR family regulator